MRRSFKYIVMVLISMIALVSGCKSKKAVTTSKPTAGLSAQRSIKQITAAHAVFNNARADNAKVSVDYAGRKVSLNADINIVRNQAIKISAKVMGIEMAIAEISTERIRLIDKLNKRYADVTYAELQNMTGIPVSFSDVQSLLVNELFGVGIEQNKIASQKPVIENQTIRFTANKINHTFTYDATTNRILSTELATVSGNNNGKLTYSNFATKDNVLFPHTVGINIQAGNRKLGATISMQRLTFDSGAFVSPTDVKRLTKISVADILP